MAQVTFATAFGHPLGVQKNMTSAFVPYRGAVPPILFDLLVTSLALGLLRGECDDHAPKGNAMARATFATAFGHPLGVQKNMTSVFVPYRGAVPPILFDLALVSGFASFGAPEEQNLFFWRPTATQWPDRHSQLLLGIHWVCRKI